jgi:FtsZ-binding cell division protein ZapB
MEEASKYIAGISAVGLLTIFVWFLKIKKTLKEELVDPEIKNVVDRLKLVEDEVKSLKENDKDLSVKLETQFNSVKESLAQTNQSIARMQGSLDIIAKRLEK